ncbi:prepilin-type N-terminal cleavage/methylation domain-containing protein [bacterium]|nr:prepilin-type N-terminal cleavage/methylation domain-containing protein [bacterium]
MLKKIFKKHTGVTLIELMIAIAIIAIVSSISIIYIQGTVSQEIRGLTEQTETDIRYVRNLATSRITYDFDGPAGPAEAVYPPGGYGVYFQDVYADSSYYIIYADSGTPGYQAGSDALIRQVTFENTAVEIKDYNNSSAQSCYFAFNTEKEVNTDMAQKAPGHYYSLEIELISSGSYPRTAYTGYIHIGELTADGYVWTNVSSSYGESSIPDPHPPPEDPETLELFN